MRGSSSAQRLSGGANATELTQHQRDAMNSRTKTALGITNLSFFAILLWSCGGEDDEGKSSLPSDPSTSTGGTIGAVGGDGDGDISLGDGDFNPSVQGRDCVADEDCAPLACHPISRTCESVGAACAAHAECAQGSFCNFATSVCLSGKAGAPCETDANCEGGGSCSGGTCGCAGFVQEQEVTEGKLDIYFVFDHSTSMMDAAGGDEAQEQDCAYTPGQAPPFTSKACLATFAFSDYLLTPPAVDTRLALQFMSFPGALTGPGSQGGDTDRCQGASYATPLIDLTQLPVDASHPLAMAVSDDTFTTSGTEIEAALRGITQYTAANKVDGREMIGVLMTDGDPSACSQDVDVLSQVVADHYAATGIRTFIIGMNGATETSLEQMAIEGGAQPHDDFCGSLTPPCHYWNVGDASGDVLSQALNAIADQSAPLGCDFPLANIQPGGGQTLDTATINVTFTSPEGVDTTVYNVGSAAECPAAEMAWHYDNPDSPTTIQLCPATCDVVGGTEGGAAIDISGGCEPTVVIPR